MLSIPLPTAAKFFLTLVMQGCRYHSITSCFCLQVKASIRQRAATIHTQGSAEAADGELEHGAEEDPLAEEHLQDMFGRTSNFSIRRALAGNDLLVGQEDSDGDEGQWCVPRQSSAGSTEL